jgi:hypothetical protein
VGGCGLPGALPAWLAGPLPPLLLARSRLLRRLL